MIHRTYCQQCGTWRFKPEGALCFHCARSGKVETEQEATPAVSEPITFGGITVDAPGFDQDRFERAVARALADALEVRVNQTGEHIVCHAGVNGGYRTTRRSCTCRAGEVGTPCKHRAALIVHLDIREPALRRQWAAAARKQVAA